MLLVGLSKGLFFCLQVELILNSIVFNEKDISRAKKMGIKDLDKKYNLNEIITGDSIFCATGITPGDLVKGIRINNNNYISETLVTHKSSNLKKIIISENIFTI